MDNQDHIPGKHPHRGIFASLIVAIMLLAGVFVLFVYSAFLAPEPEEPMASDLEEAIEDSILKNIEEAQIINDEVIVIPQEFNEEISFNYPPGWHLVITRNASSPKAWSILSGPDPITYVENAEESIQALTIRSTDLETSLATASIEDYVETERLSYESSNGEATTTQLDTEKNLYLLSSLDRYGSPIEKLIYASEEMLVVATGHIGLMTVEDWELIKNSLDFTNIQ